MIAFGEVKRVRLGINIAENNEELQSELNLSTNTGVVITSIVEGGIAAKSKLKQNEANKEKDDIGPYPIQDRTKGAQFYSMNPQFHTPLELEGKQLCATPPTLLPATFIAILLTYKSLFPFHYFSPKNPSKYHG